jgi:putative transposase
VIGDLPVYAFICPAGRAVGISVFEVLRGPVVFIEYTAEAFEVACTMLGVVQSMAAGRIMGNAASAAFDLIIEMECIHRRRLCTWAGARLRISTWIVDFCNACRGYRACDGMSPVDYERFMVEARNGRVA